MVEASPSAPTPERETRSGSQRHPREPPATDGWFTRSGAKLLLSLFAVVLLALHLLRLVEVDATALGLAALVVLPWLATILETAELPGGWKVKFREVAAEQARLESEVQWLQFLMRNFLTDYEAQHLQKFASDEPFWVEYSSPSKSYFERELRRMLDLNLIERLPNKGIRGLLYDPTGVQQVDGKDQKNVKDYMKITSQGRDYLQMRRQLGEKQ